MSYFLWRKYDPTFLVFKAGPQWCAGEGGVQLPGSPLCSEGGATSAFYAMRNISMY